jgi:hypothetical protein
MKPLLAILTIFLTCGSSFSQDTLDSTWKMENNKFRVVLEKDINDSDALKTNLSIYKDNHLLLTDTLLCCDLEIDLSDIDGDGHNDLRIFQCSGARANDTYNLFLFQKSESSFKKVKGFEDWPNLTPTKIKGILASTILIGSVEYRFFKIENSGELIDLNISEEDYNLDGKEYHKGLRKVKKLLKKSK